jgi:hypothetical protein
MTIMTLTGMNGTKGEIVSRKINSNSVFQSLDNAVTNGYSLEDWTEREIAEDLHEYDSQFEGIDPNLLVPIVRDWYNQKYRKEQSESHD